MNIGMYVELADGSLELHSPDGCIKVMKAVPSEAASTSSVLRRNGGGIAVTVTSAARSLDLDLGTEVKVAIWRED